MVKEGEILQAEEAAPEALHRHTRPTKTPALPKQR